MKRTISGLDCTLVDAPQTGSRPGCVVVLCHGFGAPGTDLVPLAEELIRAGQLTGTRFVFPQAPIQLDSDGYYDSRAWWPIDMMRLQEMMAAGELRDLRNERPELLDQRFQEINDMLQAIREETGVDNGQIVIGGFSQGAMLATETALRIRPPLGGLIAWSGSLLSQSSWTAQASEHPGIPVVQTHGRLDPILPLAGAVYLRQMLESAGWPVRFAEFNGPHTIPMPGIEMAAELIADVAGR